MNNVYTEGMTFLATLTIFSLFFICCGIGYLVAKKAFRGCACTMDPTDKSTPCCKSEASCPQGENEPKKNIDSAQS